MAGKNTKKRGDTKQTWKCERCEEVFTTRESYDAHFGHYRICKIWQAQQDEINAARREAEAAAAARAAAAATRAAAALRHRRR